MSEQDQQIVFTLEEVNKMLQYLGEVPSKYSLELISFIRGKAQEQVKQETPQTEVKEEVQE